MAKSKKNDNKPKLNLTVREEQWNKLEQMDSLENRFVCNLIPLGAQTEANAVGQDRTALAILR